MSSREASQLEMTTAIIFYCICSAGMLIVNKLAVHHVPMPGFVTSCQFSTCAALVYGMKLCGVLVADDFEWAKVKYYIIYVLSFSIGTYTNMKVLSMANVETVIVFRSCTPLAVAVFDYIFYNRAAPSARSCFSLLLITTGAIAYILTDREFQVNGWAAYYWVMIWWFVLVFQLTYGKFLVSGIPIASLWTPVLYTNSLSILPALGLCLVAGELDESRLAKVDLNSAAYFWLGASCFIGMSISYSGFWCQQLVSATTYTVVGVMNKMLTVMVNVVIWDKHASSYGIGALVLCLVGGSLYQQSPLRDSPPDTHRPLQRVREQEHMDEVTDEDGDEENSVLRPVGAPSLYGR
jgi:GDP-mannose transporter